MLNRREEAEMLIGNEVRHRLGFPSDSGLDFIVRSGAIANIPVSTRTIAALPESIQYLQGKQARKMIKKNPSVSTAMLSQETKLFCDLFYITPNSVQLDFLIAVTEFGLTLVRPIPTRTAHQLSLGMKEVLSILDRYGWSVSKVRADNEGGIGPALALIHGPPHDPVGAGTHVGQVEERVRRIKDNYRSLQASRPFKFGDALAIWAIRFSAYVLNLTPMRHSPMVCPREVLTLVKPDFKVVLPVAFADFCQVREKKTTNSVTEFRTISAVALLPTGNGSVLFASLTTGRVFTRDQFTIIKNIPQEYLLIIQVLQEHGVFAIEKTRRT